MVVVPSSQTIVHECVSAAPESLKCAVIVIVEPESFGVVGPVTVVMTGGRFETLIVVVAGPVPPSLSRTLSVTT